jgi:hypothetical protein
VADPIRFESTPELFLPGTKYGRGVGAVRAGALELEMLIGIARQQANGVRWVDATGAVAGAVGRTPKAIELWRATTRDLLGPDRFDAIINAVPNSSIMSMDESSPAALLNELALGWREVKGALDETTLRTRVRGRRVQRPK